MNNNVSSSPAAPEWRLAKGFTLFEIVIVLGLIVLIGSIGIYHISGPETEREFRDEHGKVEDLVLQARALAVSYQQPFIVRFREGVVQMQPQAKPEYDTSGVDDFEQSPVRLKSLGSQVWPRQAEIGPDYLMEISRWGRRGFIKIEGRHQEDWLFEPDGLSEPLEIRLSKHEGSQFLSRVYNPLTGLAKDEEMSIPTTN